MYGNVACMGIVFWWLYVVANGLEPRVYLVITVCVCVCVAVIVGFDTEAVTIQEGGNTSRLCVSVSSGRLGRDIVVTLDDRSPPGGCGLLLTARC